jgi:hypothetical protein
MRSAVVVRPEPGVDPALQRDDAKRSPVAGMRSGAKHRQLTPRETEIVLRLLATAMGLPRVCALKACRRRKRCRGMVCRQYRALARKRLPAAIKRIAAPPGR